MISKVSYCGKIIILGKTNVGKSTLFNCLIQKKVSIISKKTNTTQNYLMGVRTYKNYQLIYFDTPGIDVSKKSYLNKINQIIYESDIIIFVVKNVIWDKKDKQLLNIVKNFNIPVILLFNQIDKLTNKRLLLPFMHLLQKKFNFVQLIPTSAITKEGISVLNKTIFSLLPKNLHVYSKHFITNCSTSFIFSEFIREQCINQLNKELPYMIKVVIDSIKLNLKKEFIVHAFILSKNYRHKKILIGNKGKKIKKFSINAQKNLSSFFKNKIHLYIWIK